MKFTILLKINRATDNVSDRANGPVEGGDLGIDLGRIKVLAGRGAASTGGITAPMPRAGTTVLCTVRESADAHGLPPHLFQESFGRREHAGTTSLWVFVRGPARPGQDHPDRWTGELGLPGAGVYPEPTGRNDPLCAHGRATGFAFARHCRERPVHRPSTCAQRWSTAGVRAAEIG